MELVYHNQDVFSAKTGTIHLAEHEIRTQPGKIVNQRPYRVPEAHKETIREEIKKMLQLGVIEESHSDWASPIVLVPKPDMLPRFCNDFRKLNEVSEFDAYPKPLVDELIDCLGMAHFITTLDLTKGYWQVRSPQLPEQKQPLQQVRRCSSTPDYHSVCTEPLPPFSSRWTGSCGPTKSTLRPI